MFILTGWIQAYTFSFVNPLLMFMMLVKQTALQKYYPSTHDYADMVIKLQLKYLHNKTNILIKTTCMKL